jgi:hypothetical protein
MRRTRTCIEQTGFPLCSFFRHCLMPSATVKNALLWVLILKSQSRAQHMRPERFREYENLERARGREMRAKFFAAIAGFDISHLSGSQFLRRTADFSYYQQRAHCWLKILSKAPS